MMLTLSPICACAEQHMEQLISLILKVAKEQAYCFPGNKVMIFTVENEGKYCNHLDETVLERN